MQSHSPPTPQSAHADKSAVESHWADATNALWEAALRRHQGNLKLRAKRDALWLWLPLHWLLRIVTLGKSIDLIDGNYYSQLGRTIWMPGDGSAHQTLSSYVRFGILSHEIDHVDLEFFADHDARNKDADSLRKRPFFLRWLHLWKYLFWPLPFKCARYREHVEALAFSRNIEQHIAAHKGECARWYRKWLVLQFFGPSHAWPCSAERAYQAVDAQIAKVQDAFHTHKLDHLIPPSSSSKPPEAP